MPDTEPPIVVAIDIGTSSIKVGLYNGAGRSVDGSQVSVSHEQDLSPGGGVEEPAERIADAVENAVDRVVEFAQQAGLTVAGVGMDSMASTIMAVDSSGAPLTPVYTYADTRTAQDVEQLKRELDEEEVHQRTGTMQHTSYVPGRVRWLQRTAPDVAAKVDRWLDVSTYLFTRWFGRPDVASSYSIASWSGMLNRHQLQWDEKLLQHIGLRPENLPRLTPFSEPQKGLCQEFASRWPALAEVPFFPAVGDGAAVNIGTGCDGPDRASLTVGTTSAMRVLATEGSPVVPTGLWAYRLGKDATMMGGAFSEGGLLLEWAQDVLKMPPLNELDSSLHGRAPDAHGLTVLPFLAGERATGWSTRATGVFEGLRTSTTALDMVQAMMEAVSLRFALVASLLMPERPPDLQFVASGGAVRNSKWWLQTMADALDAPVVVNVEEQETGRGAALLALHALGHIKSLYDFQPRVSATFNPRPDATEVLRRAGGRQRALYSRTLG